MVDDRVAPVGRHRHIRKGRRDTPTGQQTTAADGAGVSDTQRNPSLSSPHVAGSCPRWMLTVPAA